ncbi:right-handed parallel beta-helix repeat-containing protein [Herbidospora mongoliensis]|uniref:right-handed parallel beta-helix repeat-containing protein n=1 Tax=Herbidospora mongoliensis TaxID=688067 RepID=UPI00082F2551|nr:right-handed parallel beta-helix repeat-containing protein [Herbidospora mongoliensis]
MRRGLAVAGAVALATAGVLIWAALMRPGASVPAQPSWETAGPVPLGQADYPVPDGAFFIAPTGDDASPGDIEEPWRTLAHAVETAPEGATIVLREGVYHEKVEIFRKRLAIQNRPGEVVWFDGSEPVDGWVKDGSRWRRDDWAVQFDNTDFTAGGGEDWHMVDPAFPMANWPDQVFVEDRQLAQVRTADEVGPGAFFVDYQTRQLFIGDDPVGREVRATTLDEALYFEGAHGSSLKGVGVRRYATSLARIAAVKAFADDMTIENNVFAETSVTGLSLKGARITVRNNLFAGNGQVGLGGHKSDDATIVGNISRGNNVERFMMTPVSGGLKITESRRMAVVGNLMEDNRGPGIWLDESIVGAVVARNMARNNAHHGIHFEISADALIAGNVVTGNGSNGIYVNESSDVRIWNNTVADNKGRQIYAIDGARQQLVPGVSWNVSGVEVRNNVLSAAGAEPLVAVRDLTRRKSAGDMADLDHNVYYRRGNAPLADWADWRSSDATVRTLADLRRVTGQEMNGYESPEYGDSPDGAPLPADVARLFGVEAGAVVKSGAPEGEL